MEQLLQHPVGLTVLLFCTLFLIPATIKLVVKLSMDSTPLQWMVSASFSLVTAVATVWSIIIVLSK